MLSIKVILAIIFVVTSGAVFSNQFGKNKLAVLLAGIVSIISAYYLFSEIKKDIIKELKVEGSVKKESIPELEEVVRKSEVKVENIESQKITKKEAIPKKIDEHSIVIDGLRYENRPFRKEYSWNNAVKHCSTLELDGYTNWRLPEKYELDKLFINKYKDDNIDYFIHKKFINKLEVWINPEINSSSAWSVSFNKDFNYGTLKNKTNIYYVLCVSGQ